MFSPDDFADVSQYVVAPTESYNGSPVHVLLDRGEPWLLNQEAVGPPGMGYQSVSNASWRIPQGCKRRISYQQALSLLPDLTTYHRVYWLVNEYGLSFLEAHSILAGSRPFLDWASQTIFDRYRGSVDADGRERDEMTDEATAEQEVAGATDAPVIETEIIPFTGSGLQVTRPESGREAIIIKRACSDMGLSYPAQFVKLKTAPWAEGFVAMIATKVEDGRILRMSCLDVEGVPMWLAGIDARRCNEKSRPTIVAFQKHAAKVLYEYYGKAARGERPTGPSFDAEGMGRTIGGEVGKALVPVVQFLQVLDQRSERILDRLRNVEEMVVRIESDVAHCPIDYKAIQSGPRMSLREWAARHRRNLTGDQMSQWGFAMKNGWELLGLAVEKRWLPNGKPVNIYPECGISRLFNVCAPRDVVVGSRSDRGETQQNFGFTNGHGARYPE